MSDLLQFLFVPTILFMTVLGPIWVSMHYSAKKREAKTLLADEEEALDRLLTIAETMEERLESLEKILEADDPNWKDKVR